MDISSSSAIGAMRVGLQIISNTHKPVLEFYYEVRNLKGPEQKVGSLDLDIKPTTPYVFRHQDIFIQFTLVNIGSVRAEDINFEISGKLRRNSPNEKFGELLKNGIPQMAPGQLSYLFRFDEHDLNESPKDDDNPIRVKSEYFQIIAHYNKPKSCINNLFLWFIKKFLKRTTQYESKFIFRPTMVCTDLPPVEYS